MIQDIIEEIKKVNNTNNIVELNENKKKLNEKIDNIKDETLKKEMKKCITNITNTTYGTSNENNILALLDSCKFQTEHHISYSFVYNIVLTDYRQVWLLVYQIRR